MPEGSYRFPVGSLWCTVLSDGYYAYPQEWFFPNAEPTTLAEDLEKRRTPHERIVTPYTCLLIETGRHVVLVDTGAGPAFATTGAIEARLEMAGLRPRDIDIVVLTHLHPDHIGGAVDAAGRPRFANAIHYIADAEREFWNSARPNLAGLRVPQEIRCLIENSARRGLEVLRHHLEPVERETEILTGVNLFPAPGHTPGHLAMLLQSGGRQLLNLGDAAVHPLHLEHPQWENGFDLAPAQAAATRRLLLDRAAAEGMHVMAFHFPFPSVGRVEKRGDAWQWTPGWQA
jgi:glyoxylase-like metal-dependent hydrolase (beta-lactamase superfamily II)